jgi:hypothetical protein
MAVSRIGCEEAPAMKARRDWEVSSVWAILGKGAKVARTRARVCLISFGEVMSCTRREVRMGIGATPAARRITADPSSFLAILASSMKLWSLLEVNLEGRLMCCKSGTGGSLSCRVARDKVHPKVAWRGLLDELEGFEIGDDRDGGDVAAQDEGEIRRRGERGERATKW